LKADSFDEITTGDESWFHYLCEWSAVFAKSPGDVIPRTRKEIGMKKIMGTIFFTNRKLLIAECLPKGWKYNQGCFILDIPPELEREKGYSQKKQGKIFDVHMDRSKVMMVAKSKKNSIGRGSDAVLTHLILLI
jgi:hypothetical protein